MFLRRYLVVDVLTQAYSNVQAVYVVLVIPRELCVVRGDTVVLLPMIQAKPRAAGAVDEI